MYSLIRSIPLRELLIEQLPAFGTSLLITELFFKFHSFTLECIAFLAMWYVFDAASTWFKGAKR
ncbi:hypothetical protein D3OALGA1CA_163 [Olavius algarvensis associated proteobacterium Delta 3]|nr:hypothetical protein D3OALGA1CA_163 [Olavius algarvensis associated proteobacterium Delta 3]